MIEPTSGVVIGPEDKRVKIRSIHDNVEVYDGLVIRFGKRQIVKVAFGDKT